MSVSNATAGGTIFRFSGQYIPPAATTTGITNPLFSVRVGNKLCTNVSVAEQKQSFTCQVAAGIGANLLVQLTVVNLYDFVACRINISDTDLLYSYDSPIIKQVQGSSHVPTSGGVNITVLGDNFGPVDSQPTVFLNEGRCAKTIWLSYQRLVCTVSAGFGQNLNVSVRFTTDRGADSASAFITSTPSFPTNISYDQVRISALSSAAPLPTSGGALLTITGANFGQQDVLKQLNIPTQVLIGANMVCEILTWSDSRVRCETPAGSGGGHLVTVRLGGLNFTNTNLTIAFAAPVITQIQLFDTKGRVAAAPTDGAVRLVVHGFNFGDYSINRSLSIENVGACVVLASSYNEERVECVAPEGSGTNLQVMLTVDGQTNQPSTSSLINYAAPVIDQVGGFRRESNYNSRRVRHADIGK